ncbi:AAA family ATPase [Rhodoferax sp.]|uniref:AAA family ATPase n=1 Tax=Rhodoferax sp. TaxID=50421 RepID=UPI00276445B3|nr:ATP-binding protein [Rhodoferax sp.]
MAEQALDTSLGVSGGLFLAAPRRTGKSTFVRQDLLPELRSRDVDVIYVDLWIDKSKDPAIHIANAVRAELSKDDGPISKLAKMMGVTKLTIGAMGSGLNFDLSQLGLHADSTLTDALQALSRNGKRKLVIVIDEAQHALTTDQGMAALFSLKAARDSLNTDDGLHGMTLIATGSNRDKLATLVNGREQAFYGADMIDFPQLDAEYVKWVIAKAKLNLDGSRALDVFSRLGFRPESFLRALSATRRQVVIKPGTDADALLLQQAQDSLRSARVDFLNTITSLPPLQAALLRELALDASIPPGQTRIGVFSAAMRARLQQRLRTEVAGGGEDIAVEAPSIQNAMDSLREKNFLWRSQRGAYWIEDEQFLEWLIA